MDENEQKILDAMKAVGEPLKSGDIAELVDMDKKEVSKIITKLKKEGLVSSPKRCFYSPSQ